MKVKRAKTKAGFKTYKGKHFGPVRVITRKIMYKGFPKYELDHEKQGRGGVSKMVWHDELILSRDADQISKDLVAGRKVVYDTQPRKKVVVKKTPKRATRLRKGSTVQYKGKAGVIQGYRGAGKNKEWHIKVGATLHWVLDSAI